MGVIFLFEIILEIIWIPTKKALPLHHRTKQQHNTMGKLSKDIDNIIKGLNVIESFDSDHPLMVGLETLRCRNLHDVAKLGSSVLKALGIFATLPYWAYKDYMTPKQYIEETQIKKIDLILITLSAICYIITYSYLGMVTYKNYIFPDTGIVKEKKLVKEMVDNELKNLNF